MCVCRRPGEGIPPTLTRIESDVTGGGASAFEMFLRKGEETGDTFNTTPQTLTAIEGKMSGADFFDGLVKRGILEEVKTLPLGTFL